MNEPNVYYIYNEYVLGEVDYYEDTHAFQPDYAIPPGETLREILEERGMTQADLAIHTGMAEEMISKIISGNAPITHETAHRLELALGVSASFWNNRELAYRELLIYEEIVEYDDSNEWYNIDDSEADV